MTKKKVKKSKAGEVLAVGAGITALTAAAYVLFGPDGKKNQKKIRSWAVKMKGEIIEKLEEAKEITEPKYHEIVKKISEKYGQLKNVDATELKAEMAHLKKQWQHIKKEAGLKSKKIKTKAKK